MKLLEDIVKGLGRRKLWKRLAILELKTRYQGAYLGAFWILLALIIKVTALSVIYSMVLEKDFKSYVMFLALGVLTWNFIAACLVTSVMVFKKASHFMLQMEMPHSVFIFQNTYREVISLLLYQLFAVPLVLFISGFDVVTLTWLWALLGYVLIILNGFFVSMWLGWAGIRFPDVQPMMASVVLILFLITPVLWPPPEQFADSLYFQLNPFYHLLELIRAPILHNTVPVLSIYVALGALVVNVLVCCLVYPKVKDKLVLWM